MTEVDGGNRAARGDSRRAFHRIAETGWRPRWQMFAHHTHLPTFTVGQIFFFHPIVSSVLDRLVSPLTFEMRLPWSSYPHIP